MHRIGRNIGKEVSAEKVFTVVEPDYCRYGIEITIANVWNLLSVLLVLVAIGYYLELTIYYDFLYIKR